MNFHHGLRLRACFRSFVRCGIIATTFQSTTMALCGAREVHRAHFYSFWSLRPVANNCYCLTMLPYLVAIWAGPEPWLGCHTASIGRACRTTLNNGWVSVWHVYRGSRRWAATTPWEISPPVIAGIVLQWISWTSVTLHRRDSDTSW